MAENALSRVTYHDFSVHWHNDRSLVAMLEADLIGPSMWVIGSLGHAPQQMCRSIRPLESICKHDQAVLA